MSGRERYGLCDRRTLRRWLLSGVSLFALVTASATARAFTRNNGQSAPSAEIAAQILQHNANAAAQAQAQIQRSLATAMQRMQSNLQAQNIARQSFISGPGTTLFNGQPLPKVPDGLGAGGLDLDTQNAPLNAKAPTQDVQNGQTVVTAEQLAQNAIYSWKTFNVGANTTLNFLQQGSDWTILNRVTGSADPSQILGHVNANGTVLVINQNGILFGPGAQVNVHSLIASSLDVGSFGMSPQARDQFFLKSGIAANAAATAFSSSIDLKDLTARMDGDIIVQRGAQITTSIEPVDAPGFVYLFGPNVTNSGTITSPAGEVALVSAYSISLLPNVYDRGHDFTNTLGTNSSLSVDIRGTGFGVTPYGTATALSRYRIGTGQVVNDGLISTPRGITILNGDRIDVSGVISADTSISRNSQIFIDAVTRVDMSGTISVLPFDNGETLPLVTSTTNSTSSVQAFVAPSIGISAFQVVLEPSTLISAPGATVAVNGTASNYKLSPNVGVGDSEKVWLQSQTISGVTTGATIDVAGLQDVLLPASYNIVAFQPRGSEFADEPLQRSGPLFGATLYIDIRDTGTRSDGSKWIGTPVADASGFVSLVGRSISQLLTTGGSVSLKTELLASNSQVVIDSGATINVAGGSVRYSPGFVPTTTLIGSDGKTYDISQADPNLTYSGILGNFVVDHTHWNVSETYLSRMQLGFQPGYSEGHDAGGISIQSVRSPVLDGTFVFGANAGPRQIAAGQSPSGTVNGMPAQANGNELPSQGYLTLVSPQSFIIADGPANPSTVFTSNSASPFVLSADRLSGYGLSGLSITANDLYLPARNALTLAPGGHFSAKTSGAIDVEGSIIAQGGQIELATDSFGLQNSSFQPSQTASQQSDVYIGGTLDVHGRWVNDYGVPTSSLTGPGFINGGAVSIKTFDADGPGATGNIILAQSSVLDVSSGGYINQKGAMKADSSGVPSGKGGDITLATFQGNGFDVLRQSGPLPPNASHDATVQLGGTLFGYGFSGGGTLTIYTPSYQIGGTPSTDKNILNLPVSFFSSGGFGSYVLKSPADTGTFARGLTLAANEIMRLQQQNFSNVDSYLSVPTGANIGSIAARITLPTDLRRPVNLTLASGNTLIDTGSAIVADPKASINISTGVYDLATKVDPKTALLLLGSITDHGGSLVVQSPYVWLGNQATLDFSGTFIANSTFGSTGGVSQSGTLLPGGTVTFDTSPAGQSGSGAFATGVLGFVIAESGASIDVSGAAAVITGRVASQGGAGPSILTDVPSWTDGGTISFNTKTFLWDGTFKADAGAPQGNRGTLNLGGNAVALQQDNQSGFSIGGSTVEQAVPALKSFFNLTTPTALATNGSTINGFAIPVIAAADHLSSFDTVYLYGGTYKSTGGQGFLSSATPLPSGATESVLSDFTVRSPLTIYGKTVNDNGVQTVELNLDIRNRLYLEASEYLPSAGLASASLSANYVLLTGRQPTTVVTGGSSALTIAANTIDVQTAVFRNFSSVTFNSQGDIRLSTPPVNNGEISRSNNTGLNLATFFGSIVSGGNLTFNAQRIYPVTGVDFEIASTKPDGLIQFGSQSPGVPDIPLSAGGGLTVSAANIVQDGNLFAPLGHIVLGAQTVSDLSPNDPNAANNFVAANSVKVGLKLGPDGVSDVPTPSVTSVSLSAITVPYGQTEDGTNWFYNSDTSPLTGPPGKALSLLGKDVKVGANATIDISGGSGDLLAFEFVQGKGGSKDVLSNIVPTGSATRAAYTPQAVYALLPSTPGKTQDQVGAFDIHFNSFLGDRVPLAGQQVYLSGGNGVAAGWYTLYPAHYAILPGALRVVDYGNTLAKPFAAGTTLPDGTQIIGGYFGQSNLGTRSSGTELFAIQAGPVWRQYTELDPSLANVYFANKAIHDNVVRPPLPIDAGRLGVAASGVLDLEAVALSTSVNLTDSNGNVLLSGRGGQLDLSAQTINVIETSAPATTGTNIDVHQLNASGFESILIGGRRTDQADGTLITATATNVNVDIPNTPFVAPEIILVAGPALEATPSLSVPKTGSGGGGSVLVRKLIDGTGKITVSTNSIITASGSVGATGRNYVIGGSLASFLGGTVDAATGNINGVAASSPNIANYASQSGAGALVLVSDDANVNVTRHILGPVTVNLVTTPLIGAPQPAGTVVLPGVPANSNLGQVIIAAGAQVGNGLGKESTRSKTLIVDATGTAGGIQVSPNAVIGADTLRVAASSVGIGDHVAANTGFTITQNILFQLSSVSNLTLTARAGNIDFYSFDNVAGIDFGASKSLGSLILDASSLVNHNGQKVTVGVGGTLTLVNSSTNTPSTVTDHTGSFLLDVGDPTAGTGEIVLGGGAMNISGFDDVAWRASKVLINGAGSMNIGGSGSGSAPIDVTILTPNLMVGGGSSGANGTGTQFVLTTLGDLQVIGTRSALQATDQIGGNLQINAGSITLNNATIQAQSGTVTLHATAQATDPNTGQVLKNYVIVGDNSTISAPGYAQTFFDTVKYTPGGTVVLVSDFGDVATAPTSVINLSQPVNGLSKGGELDVTALQGNASLQGKINAMGAPGLGGIFHLNIKGALGSQGGLVNSSFDELAKKLNDGGFSDEINIHTRTGGIVLGDVIPKLSLAAHKIVLTADDVDDVVGRIQIREGATLDASGASGGSIEMYARSVDVFGSLIAKATEAGQSGGTITIGTSGTQSGITDPTYGNELLSGAGLLNIGRTARFDLSGGPATQDGFRGSDGDLNLRAPLITIPNVGPRVSVQFAESDQANQIVGVKNITLEAYAIWSTTDASTGSLHFDGFVDPAGKVDANGAASGTVNINHRDFYQTTLVNFVQNYLNPLTVAQTNLFPGSLPANTAVHLRPGIVLQNPDLTINNGNITVASNWNLAAGTMSNLQNFTNPNGTVSRIFAPTSAIQFLYRYGVEPGALTLRAVHDVNINASISDGFFHTQNLLDQTYLNNITTSTFPWMALPPAPVPTDATANTASWNEANSLLSLSTSLASYDLFPSTFNVIVKNPDGTTSTKTVGMDSWSYRFTAGSDFGSANPNAVGSIAAGGDVVINGHTSFATSSLPSQLLTQLATGQTSLNLPTMVRTGTGSITVNAARDLGIADTVAPGVIYTAGRNSQLLPDAQITNIGGAIRPYLVIGNEFGFVEPNIIVSSYSINNSQTAVAGAELGKLTGPPTAAAFPEGAGDIVIDVQRDIIGWQNITTSPTSQTPLFQFYAPWLLTQSGGTSGAGAFTPTNPTSALAPAPSFAFAQQSAWWIEFGRFDQGVLSAGGNVTVTAGRDIRDFSVSLPTTGRISGGLTPTDLPVGIGTQNISSLLSAGGSFIINGKAITINQGDNAAAIIADINRQTSATGVWASLSTSGHLVLKAANADISKITLAKDPNSNTSIFSELGISPISYVSNGQPNTPQTHLYESGDLLVRAGRDLLSGSFYEGSGIAQISVGGSVRSDWSVFATVKAPANAGGVATTKTIPVSTVLAVDTGQLNLTAAGSITITDIINPGEIHPSPSNGVVVMSTYGPESAIRLSSIGGNISIDAVPGLLSNTNPAAGSGGSAFTAPSDVTQTYPAIFEATAFTGNITTPQFGFVLTDSPTATLNLLARGNIDLRGGVIPGSRDSSGTLAAFGPIGAGAALIDLAFNPYEPNFGGDAANTPFLAHSADSENDLYDRIYAETGDIKSAGIIQVPRPVLIQAGRDIVDLNLTAQNIRPTDVSVVSAGRDLFYTGLAIGGGLQIAGPGFFDVEAGRDLGPFLPNSADNAANVATQQGIVSSGNAAKFLASIGRRVSGNAVVTTLQSVQYPVGNNLDLIGLTNAQFLGPFGASTNAPPLNGASNRLGQRNFLLSDEGATIVAMFGIAPGVNYKAVQDTYLNPANSAVAPHNYLGRLQIFLASLGIVTADTNDAWAVWPSLSPQLQRIFIDQIFFAELATVTSSKAQPGYAIIDTLFPGAFGYTQNSVGGGVNGAPSDRIVKTGDLNLLHSTIQTDRGGDVMILGPGGEVLVGSVATEPNSNLKLNNLGILTLDGGDVLMFADRSVLVNSSRIFTEFGGDILLWSSNGDLDAGRGSRTTVSLNPLKVNIDNNDYQTIDPTGLVTGAGIGTLQTSSDAEVGDVTLLAPNGKIDAGDAGIRSSGNLVVVAPVVLNADNIRVGGSTSGIPTATAPSVVGLTSASNTTAQATRTVDTTPTGTTPGPTQQSIVIVEVLGYGGGGENNPDEKQPEEKKDERKSNE